MKNLQNFGNEWSSADLKRLEKLTDGNTPTGLIAYQLKSQRCTAKIRLVI